MKTDVILIIEENTMVPALRVSYASTMAEAKAMLDKIEKEYLEEIDWHKEHSESRLIEQDNLPNGKQITLTNDTYTATISIVPMIKGREVDLYEF